MRGLILLSLVTVAFAAPQHYNFANLPRQPHQEYGSPTVATSATDFLKDLQAVMALQSSAIENSNFAYNQANDIEQYPTALEQASLSPSSFSNVQPKARYLAPSIATATNTLQPANLYESSMHKYTQQQLVSTHKDAIDTEPIISKRFYLHSAPEEEDDEIQQKYFTVGKARKNFNVVFIRAPAKSAQRTSIKITPALSEDKTVIYVLAKKEGATEIDAQVHEPVTTTTKPEVYFIKYKTQEEADHAQHTIQAQYDALGGSTHILNEGIAPVSSVIGSLDTAKHASVDLSSNNDAQYTLSDDEQVTQEQDNFLNSHAHQSQQNQYEQAIGTSNAYLPPSLRH